MWMKGCQLNISHLLRFSSCCCIMLMFAAQVSYPPPRSCTHTTPLIPGTRPISIRPYYYAPTLKDEIECQVQEMLQAGLIQPSNSPFSSPILLVKKKDKSLGFVWIIATLMP
jgi:hypothetical protein